MALFSEFVDVLINLLDRIPRNPVLDPVGDWPKSATRKVWFQIARELDQQTIAGMDFDPEVMSEVEKSLIVAGLL